MTAMRDETRTWEHKMGRSGPRRPSLRLWRQRFCVYSIYIYIFLFVTPKGFRLLQQRTYRHWWGRKIHELLENRLFRGHLENHELPRMDSAWNQGGSPLKPGEVENDEEKQSYKKAAEIGSTFFFQEVI